MARDGGQAGRAEAIAWGSTLTNWLGARLVKCWALGNWTLGDVDTSALLIHSALKMAR